jgi:hypothetical protein
MQGEYRAHFAVKSLNEFFGQSAIARRSETSLLTKIESQISLSVIAKTSHDF